MRPGWVREAGVSEPSLGGMVMEEELEIERSSFLYVGPLTFFGSGPGCLHCRPLVHSSEGVTNFFALDLAFVFLS